MISMVILEICTGFSASFRRNPWAVFLLWLGLSASTVGVVGGFTAASFSLHTLRYLLPGNLENLVYAEIGTAGEDQLALSTTRSGITIESMQGLIDDGLADGFFTEVTGRSVMTHGGEAFTTQVTYAGKTALRGGLISAGLENARSFQGVAVNEVFSQRYQVTVGDSILVNPWTSLIVVAVVGPQPLLDRLPVVYIPAEAVPASTIDADIGFYLPFAAETSTDAPYELAAAIQQQYKGIFVHVESGLEVHRFALRELRIVTILSIGGALMIALVGFVNAGSLISYWVLRRLQGLAIRRTIGIPTAFLWLSLVADNLAIGVSAAVAGGTVALLLTWIIAPQVPVQASGLFGGICLMLAGTIAVSFFLARPAFRQEPGVALRRSM